MKSYYKWVNIARGFGIILVVIGHALTDTLGCKDGSVSKLIFDIIYSFHMPLFFFLSGFLAAKALNMFTLKDKTDYVIQRFKRLMVPYFCVGLLYVPLKLFLAAEVTTKINPQTLVVNFLEGYNPNYQLWTLYALFISAAIITVFACKTASYKWWVLFAGVLMNLFWAISYCPVNIINEVCFQFLFFALGVIYRSQNQTAKIKTPYFVLSAAIFVIGNILYQQFALDIFKTITGITGIIVVCEACKRIENNKNTVLNIVGKYGMDIYIMANIVQVLIRSVFLNRLHFPGIVCFFMSVTLGIALPVLVSKYIVRKLKITRITILGDYS